MNNTGMFTVSRAAGTIVLFIILISYFITGLSNPSLAWIETLVYAVVVVGAIIWGTSLVWPIIESEV